ncbi:TIR domain-containing protein [Actinoallomurus iriomotensis]|uniref:TIR domain-containing protein n=1 Tax=Actinoallomurus iriomotensis TaxID=478107 RepID=A0A9W6S1Q3_9ACTN|nr:TIR domain-containing protein [Actinoallomurus iriomotensis]GLY85666.1 hypothetical protein Airi02_035950 [Actinoallomurus iriomotensis]
MVSHHAFISYNSQDGEIVHEIARRLVQDKGIFCWLDVWSLVPGRAWQNEIEAAISNCDVMLVALGKHGVGAWHHEEFRTAIDLFAEKPDERRVIPLLLPGAGPDVNNLIPQFLRRFTYIDLRSGITPHQLDRLAAGIRGEPPGPPGELRTSRPFTTTPSAPREISPWERRTLSRIDSILRVTERWVSSIQNRDGGLPSDADGTSSCTWTSAGMVYAINRRQRTTASGHWLRRTLTWVLDNRNRDGGVPLVIPGDPSITDATAQALLACAEMQRVSPGGELETTSDDLIDWLLNRQQPSGGWAWRTSDEDAWTASTAYALHALSVANDVLGERPGLRDAITSGLSWLRDTRNDDCGWGSQAGRASQPAVSGLAMFCLAEIGLREFAAESGDYLRQKQNDEGGWQSTIDRPTGHSIIRFGDAHALAGMASAGYSDHEDVVRRGFDALIKSFKGSYFQYGDTAMKTWPTRDGLLAISAVASSIRAPGPEY